MKFKIVETSDLYQEKALRLLENARNSESQAARDTFLVLAAGWDEMAQQFRRPKLN